MDSLTWRPILFEGNPDQGRQKSKAREGLLMRGKTPNCVLENLTGYAKADWLGRFSRCFGESIKLRPVHSTVHETCTSQSTISTRAAAVAGIHELRSVLSNYDKY